MLGWRQEICLLGCAPNCNAPAPGMMPTVLCLLCCSERSRPLLALSPVEMSSLDSMAATVANTQPERHCVGHQGRWQGSSEGHVGGLLLLLAGGETPQLVEGSCGPD